eukprot:gnl/Chilomastix_caulleri/7647.p1 GENE.gnl/Chilomastix_caulleri/7647~~gnl/Chilomastix_caulleri/7647.p1  ORF type:complete len:111 (-),score=21.96 gnl/Chilomastix_caulleri/7647:31-318(-)
MILSFVGMNFPIRDNGILNKPNPKHISHSYHSIPTVFNITPANKKRMICNTTVPIITTMKGIHFPRPSKTFFSFPYSSTIELIKDLTPYECIIQQ